MKYSVKSYVRANVGYDERNHLAWFGHVQQRAIDALVMKNDILAVA